MKSRGYTVIEVMMALAVLTMGASGVIAMQKATIISNVNARNLATANGIAQSWIERLRTDALSWNEQSGVPDLPSTQWLNKAVIDQVGSGWFIPTKSGFGLGTVAGSPSGDILGADIHTYSPSVDPFTPAFCTQLRITRFADTKTGDPLAGLYKLMRVEVRVVWARSGQMLNCATPPPLPVNSKAPTWDAAIGDYGFVYLVSAVLENGAPT